MPNTVPRYVQGENRAPTICLSQSASPNRAPSVDRFSKGTLFTGPRTTWYEAYLRSNNFRVSIRSPAVSR